MKIVGTIIDRNLRLVGLLLKGKPSEFGFSGGKEYSINPFKLDEVKELIEKGKIKDYKVNEKGEIEGINKKLSDLPMYDTKGTHGDKKMELRATIERKGALLGAVVFFYISGKEKKLKLEDLIRVYEYFEPTNFILRNRDNNYYITGKGEVKKEDIPVIEKDFEKTIETIPYTITKEDSDYFIKNFIKDSVLEIPETFTRNGKTFRVIGIDDLAFVEKNEILQVSISDSVCFINDAFIGCPNLRNIVISKGVEKISDKAFSSCEYIEMFEVDSRNPNYSSVGGVLYNKDKTELIKYTNGKQNNYYEIPNSVIKIRDFAFYGVNKLFAMDNLGLRILYIPKTVKQIGKDNFNNFINGITLKYSGSKQDWEDNIIVLDNSIENNRKVKLVFLDEYNVHVVKKVKNRNYFPLEICHADKVIGFKGEKDEKLVIPAYFERNGYYYEVVAIKDFAFKDCTDLYSIVIPKTVKHIDGRAFTNCSNLKYLYFIGTEKEWDKIRKVDFIEPLNFEVICNYKNN